MKVNFKSINGAFFFKIAVSKFIYEIEQLNKKKKEREINKVTPIALAS
jgi:hypothetical protein